MKSERDFYGVRAVYYGDLHNHCDISYGHGSLEEAYRNARVQLDFASVTGHGAWPDILDKPMPPAVVDYHRSGFAKLRDNWRRYLATTEGERVPDSFETFFGYEIHSFRHGDRTVVSPYPLSLSEAPDTPQAFGTMLRDCDARRDGYLLLPHHIGYATGYRGVDWESVTNRASPVVEIVSMHGLAESDDGTFPYLHTMGPLDGGNTMVGGLKRGLHFGVVGSTDHHSAHPGSFGYGKTAVWAESLTRESLWEAILSRRTYAVSGDRIHLAFSLNGAPLGSVIAASAERLIEVRAVGGGAIDHIEIVKNARAVHRYTHRSEVGGSGRTVRGKLAVEFGWGQKGEEVEWNVKIRSPSASIIAVEPRFRGRDVVDPLDTTDGPYAFSRWSHDGDTVTVSTMTFGNATTTSSQTQAISLELEGRPEDTIEVEADGIAASATLGELAGGARTHYTAGFVSPALKIHRFVREADYTAEFRWRDETEAEGAEDVYYVRVIQKNGHGAWSSPIWVTNESAKEV